MRLTRGTWKPRRHYDQAGEASEINRNIAYSSMLILFSLRSLDSWTVTLARTCPPSAAMAPQAVKILSSAHLHMPSDVIYHRPVGVYPRPARWSTDHW